jgi:hypothetical protein
MRDQQLAINLVGPLGVKLHRRPDGAGEKSDQVHLPQADDDASMTLPLAA